MPAKSSSWAIGAGSLVVLVSLCLLASSVMDQSDHSLLAVALSVFSMGILAIAVGLYLRANALTSQAKTEEGDGRKSKGGGCERCQVEPPVIHCRVHHLHLCGSCLAEHYDFRSCAYVPTTRRPKNKAGKAMAARSRA